LDVSYETIWRWVGKFGPAIARNLRQLRAKPSSRWHLDEMVVRINGRQMYPWRAVDDKGEVLEVLIQSRRNKAAARKLIRKLLRKHGFALARVTPEQPGRGLAPAGPPTTSSFLMVWHVPIRHAELWISTEQIPLALRCSVCFASSFRVRQLCRSARAAF
jgi:hypothetical protein